MLFIRHYDQVKQYYTLETPSSPGRPILAPIEALQCGEDFVIAARYYQNDKSKNTEEDIKLHEYQSMKLETEDTERFHLLSQLHVSDLIKTVILYEKMINF